MKPLVIIGCGDKKAPSARMAKDLYVGPYFRQALATARHLTPEDRIIVLSGSHGIVPLDRILAPYNQRIDGPGAISPERILQQAEEMHLLEATEVVILAGSSYARIALAVWPHASTPLQEHPRFLQGLKALRSLPH